MTDKNILVLSETGRGFLERASEKVLQTEGYNVDIIAYNDKQLQEYIKGCDVVLLILGDNMVHQLSFLSIINSVCQEYNKKIFIHGNEDKIDDVTVRLELHLIAGTFVRPVDLNSMVKRINHFLERSDSPEVKKTVLVVDDSGMMLRKIMKWLEFDYQVNLANSAASAFGAIQKQKPDLILLDYEMPICSGAMFMEMLKNEETNNDIPIIFLTSRDDAQTVTEVLKLKPAGYLLKSMPEDLVLKRIAEFFEKQSILLAGKNDE